MVSLQFSHIVLYLPIGHNALFFLVSFIPLPWTAVLVRLQLHSSSTSTRFFVSAYLYDEGVQEFLTMMFIIMLML
jgi:hypothetical protein